MKKSTLKKLVALALVMVLAFGMTGSAFAVEIEQEVPQQAETTAGTIYYGAMVTLNPNGGYDYVIDSYTWSQHSGWYVEYAGSSAPNQTITQRTGTIYPGTAVNFYFHYTS